MREGEPNVSKGDTYNDCARLGLHMLARIEQSQLSYDHTRLAWYLVDELCILQAGCTMSHASFEGARAPRRREDGF